MKKLVLSLAILTLLFTSCTSNDDETTTPVTPPPTQGSGELKGDVTANKTYVKGSYTLDGVLKIKTGVSLTFEAGSVITANNSFGSTFDAILVENGGKLIMNGTAAEPIVCTHQTKISGSWGGIIMYGNAPIVGAAGVTTANAEDGISPSAGTPAYSYGGNDAVHSSGTLKFVRVEYAGKKIADGSSELNGFSFYAVGSGTILENLVSYKGNDDGFEFYGGTVSAKNLISYGNSDDSFDWQDGWRGQDNTNWYAYQTGTGNYGMEIEAKNVDNSFWPVVSGITLKRAAGTLTEDGTPQYDAIQFKSRGNGFYSNILITGYTNSLATAVRIQDAGTNTSQVNANKIKLTNIKINDGTSPYAAKDGTSSVLFPIENFVTSLTATGATITPGAWAVVDGVNLLQ